MGTLGIKMYERERGNEKFNQNNNKCSQFPLLIRKFIWFLSITST